MKKHLQDSLVIGFALFSMFFGAGNVIFPPYLGLESGPEWLAGFFSYFMADIGLALLAMFAILRQGSPDGITARIGRIPSTALMCAIVLCIGPMLAIPRTAATTYETSLAPLVSGFSPALFSILFFLLILLLCVRETAVVDIVGKILTPALLIGLLILIVVGVVNPIGPVGEQPLVENVAATGVEAGYQTMDVLAAIVFGYIILKSAREKGHTTPGAQLRVVSGASLVAGIGRPLLRHHRGPHVPGGVHCPEPVGAGGHHPLCRGGGSGLRHHRCGAGQRMRRLLLRPLGGPRFLPHAGVRHLRVQCRGIQLWSQ